MVEGILILYLIIKYYTIDFIEFIFFLFFQLHEEEYSNLSRMARDYLAIPG